MDIRTFFFALAIAGISNSVFAQEQRPQQPRPQEQQQQPAADPYTERNKQVQEALRQRGLFNGPVNGVIGPNTQAAIARFQQSWPMPVNGMLDDHTLAALGIEAPTQASAGATAE